MRAGLTHQTNQMSVLMQFLTTVLAFPAASLKHTTRSLTLAKVLHRYRWQGAARLGDFYFLRNCHYSRHGAPLNDISIWSDVLPRVLLAKSSGAFLSFFLSRQTPSMDASMDGILLHLFFFSFFQVTNVRFSNTSQRAECIIIRSGTPHGQVQVADLSDRW